MSSQRILTYRQYCWRKDKMTNTKETTCPQCGEEDLIDIDDDVTICEYCDFQYDIEEGVQ